MAFYNIIIFSPKDTMPSPLYKPITNCITVAHVAHVAPDLSIHMKKSITTAKNNLFLALDDVRRPLPSLHR